jgi:hypothetical protein
MKMELPPLEVRFMSTVEAYKNSSSKRYIAPKFLQFDMGNCSSSHLGEYIFMLFFKHIYRKYSINRTTVFLYNHHKDAL